MDYLFIPLTILGLSLDAASLPCYLSTGRIVSAGMKTAVAALCFRGRMLSEIALCNLLPEFFQGFNIVRKTWAATSLGVPFKKLMGEILSEPGARKNFGWPVELICFFFVDNWKFITAHISLAARKYRAKTVA